MRMTLGIARCDVMNDAEMPEDISAEQGLLDYLRREPGMFKRRNKTPNLFVLAWRTPGELANMFLFVVCYLTGMAVYVNALGAERAREIPGIAHCLFLALLIVPAYFFAGRIWRIIGISGRNVVRLCIRFWPLTLVVAFWMCVSVVKVLSRHP
jgi:hypothetical protein